MSKALSPFQQEAQLVITKANSLGFNFSLDGKLTKVTWGYTEEMDCGLIQRIHYKLLRAVGTWSIQSTTEYKVVNDEANGVFTTNINKNEFNRGGEQDCLVCIITEW